MFQSIYGVLWIFEKPNLPQNMRVILSAFDNFEFDTRDRNFWYTLAQGFPKIYHTYGVSWIFVKPNLPQNMGVILSAFDNFEFDTRDHRLIILSSSYYQQHITILLSPYHHPIIIILLSSYHHHRKWDSREQTKERCLLISLFGASTALVHTLLSGGCQSHSPANKLPLLLTFEVLSPATGFNWSCSLE